MLKWLVALFVAVGVAAVFAPYLARVLGRARLPGDVTVRFRGRIYFLPFATALLLSLLATLILRLL